MCAAYKAGFSRFQTNPTKCFPTSSARAKQKEEIENSRKNGDKQESSSFQNVAKKAKPGEVIVKFNDYEPLPSEKAFIVS